MYLCMYHNYNSKFTVNVLLQDYGNSSIHNCDWIWKTSKSHMKSNVFLHVFNDISIYVYVFPKYFLNTFSNLSTQFYVRSIMNICNTVHVAVINITK